MMILFKATEDQVKQMGALASNASRPMGMGFMHFDAKSKFQAKEFTLNDEKMLSLDYVQGRMVKLTIWNTGPDQWKMRERLLPDYQSWMGTYPKASDLIEAAGGTVTGREE